MQTQSVQPVLKWAGGKRQLIPKILKHITAQSFKTYYEPFLGGGAVFFHLKPVKAVVNDLNAELINVYTVIKNSVEELIAELVKHRNEKDYFYQVREMDRNGELKKMSDVQRAARIIFLNKTCYNGLFRVNSRGEFNTPFGKYKNPNIVNAKVLRAVSDYLNESNITLLNVDFEEAVRGVDKDSFVYFDPPYFPVSGSSSFTGYTFGGFNMEEQLRLKKACDMLNKKGVRFLLSNSAVSFNFDIYNEYKIEIVEAVRNINSVAGKRGEINEILVRNF